MLSHEKKLAQTNTLTTTNTDSKTIAPNDTNTLTTKNANVNTLAPNADAINTTPTADLNTATSPISATQLILDPLQDSISSLELVRVSDSDADVVNAARVSFGKQIMSLTERDEKLIALQL
jgi:hypothetical protein